MSRIFFATDVHGSELAFRKFVNAGKFYKVDVLILGGDITGKMIVPIVQNGDSYTAYYYDTQRQLQVKELKTYEDEMKNSGYYPYHCSKNELSAVSSDKKKADEVHLNLMKERLGRWVKLIEENLANSEIAVYVTGGNDDPIEIEDILRASDVVVDPESGVVRIDAHHEMISSGLSNPTPWKTPRETSEEVLAERLEDLVSKLENVETSIFNIHVPPKDSGLDTCPKLDDSVYPPKMVLSQGRAVEFGAGSSSVRKAIEAHQPMLGLFGHIHESRGAIKMGRTLCINPGSEYAEGILRGVIIELKNDKIKRYQMTSG